MNCLAKFIIKIPSQMALLLLRFYKYFISPLLPMSCRFTPSCSEYGVLAIQKYGFLKGALKTIGRLGRCHPFSKCSGFDPP